MLELRNFPVGNQVRFSGRYPLYVFVVLQGSGTALLKGSEVELFSGMAFFCSTGSCFLLTAAHGLRGVLISVEAALFDYFLLHYPSARGLGLFERMLFLDVGEEELGLVGERLEVLRDELQRGVGMDRLKLIFCLLMVELGAGRVVLDEPVWERRVLVDEFRKQLERNFRAIRSVRFYAQQLGVSPRQLNALCRGWYGKGFFKVLTGRLIAEAEHRLISSDDPIKLIAYELGFSSLQHFRAYFVRFRGMGPVAFRSSSRKSGTPRNVVWKRC